MTTHAADDPRLAWHEAFTLPLVLLSAALLGGVRIDAGGGLAFVPPTLFALVFDVAWLVLLGNTLAARPDRPRLLSSLMVIFGAAFVVKFILLGALYAPDASLTKRVVMALVEGVSLGALAYQPPGPATGYVTFAAGLLLLAGISALPHRRDRDDVVAAPRVVPGVLIDGSARTSPAVLDAAPPDRSA